jgi:hypothetical protein
MIFVYAKRGVRRCAVALSGATRWLILAAVLGLLMVVLPTAGSGRPEPGRPARSPASSSYQQRHGFSAVPVDARGVVSRTVGADDRGYWARRSAHGVVTLRDPAQRLRASLRGGAISVAGAAGVRLRLSAPRVGRGGALGRPAGLSAAATRQNRVTFSTHALQEWFATGPGGIEQGFTVVQRPAGSGPLIISQAVSGGLSPHADSDGQAVILRSRGAQLRYGELSVIDARGRPVPARLAVAGGRLNISIDDARAAYPLRVDPVLTQQGAKLTGTGETGSGRFGISVALSSDGNTALIGANKDGFGGAAWVFTRSGSTWTQQGTKLTPLDGGFGDQFGSSVALSSDGNTALIGGPVDNSNAGAAWCSRARARPGPSRARSSPARARAAAPPASGAAWRCRAMAIRR